MYRIQSVRSGSVSAVPTPSLTFVDPGVDHFDAPNIDLPRDPFASAIPSNLLRLAQEGADSEIWERAREAWGRDQLPEHLLQRAIADARRSNLVSGSSVQTTSPLGVLNDAAAIGEWQADAALNWFLQFGDESPPSDFELELVGPAVVRWRVHGFGAAAFLRHSFVVPVAPGSARVIVEEEETDLLETDRAAILEALEPFDDIDLKATLCLRVYEGANTRTTDLTLTERNGFWQLPAGVFVQGAVLAGRVCWSVGTRAKPASDPTLKWRMAHAKRKVTPWDPAVEAPVIEALDPKHLAPPAHLFVAVHGTMASSIPLARRLGELREGDSQTLTRFEHDTWLPVSQNAEDLSRAVADSGTQRVTFVAHSRGGLVALLAMTILRRERPEIVTNLVALGSPFDGTPVIKSAKGGVLGAVSLTGALQPFSRGGIDPVTRLSGLVIGGQLPRGLLDMNHDESNLLDYLALAVEGAGLDLHAFGGRASPGAGGDSFAVKLIAGFTDRAFRGRENTNLEDNDYVVGTQSALRFTPGTHGEVVDSDHFSYLSAPRVEEYIRSLEPHGR
jgi:pimeloyl-ACP methyl ester carboxylesterase